MRRIVLFISLLVFSCGSNASIVKYDWLTTGDDSIIYDNASNLEWLSLSQTVGETYDYIEQQFGLTGEYNGFRFASLEDVRSLVENAGSSWGECYDCFDEISPMENLIQLIGSGHSYSSGISTWGYTQSDNASSFYQGVMLRVDYNANIKGAFTLGGFQSSNPYNNLGGFLVRTVKVPEPNTLMLIIISLISMIFIRNKYLSKQDI